MKTITIENNIPLIGFEVDTFPEGITAAFQRLMEMIEDGNNRDYYGISNINAEGKIMYRVAAQVISGIEPGKYSLEEYKVESGNYLVEIVTGWKEKLFRIKDIFVHLMEQEATDSTQPCIEWYYSENEMMCMLKTK